MFVRAVCLQVFEEGVADIVLSQRSRVQRDAVVQCAKLVEGKGKWKSEISITDFCRAAMMNMSL